MSLCNKFPALLWDAAVEEFDQRCYFYPGRDCPGWEYGSICARIQREIPAMSEDTGWPPAEPEDAQAEVQPEPDAEAPAEPAEEATPLPGENADPQQVADEAAAAEPRPADHVPPPFIPDGEGVSAWLRNALLDLHRRLKNLGG